MSKRIKRVSRVDVANLAGVSTATVSYVLNNKQNVRNETRERVLDAARQLDYRPDPIARSMITNKSMQLSIVLNNIANPIYSDMIIAFEKKALEHGYFVNICTGQGSIDEYFENFVDRRIDGIFIEALPGKYHIEKVYKLVDAGIKVTMFGHGSIDIRRVSSIENDYIYTMDRAIDHLWTLGHRRIAYLSGLTLKQNYDLRIDGYYKAMDARKAGDVAKELGVYSSRMTNTDISVGRSLARELIDKKHDFTAVICTNDLMAIGTMQIFQEAGMSIPGDVSVMGIDGACIGDIIAPKLTTMGVSYRDIGSKAFDLLYADLQNDTTGFFQNRPKLIVRESTAVIN